LKEIKRQNIVGARDSQQHFLGREQKYPHKKKKLTSAHTTCTKTKWEEQD
jgi:hypothetical protein